LKITYLYGENRKKVDSRKMHLNSIPAPFKFLAITLALTVTTGCKNENSKVNDAKPTLASKVNKELPNHWPLPDTYVEGIPVYDTFTGIEPMFQFDNDTTYVVNFWATWCKPCIKELPYFEEFNSNRKTEKVKVVLVSLDFPRHLETKLVPFVREQQLKSKVVVLLDGKYNDWIDKVSPEWSGAIPATYIYKGRQNHLVPSPFETMEELIEVVKPFL